MLTETPDTFASSYQCGMCGIYVQVLIPSTDENGSLLVREDGSMVFYNDEPNASAEMNEHIAQDHADATS